MKIIRLQAENIKRLKAIDITPESNTVIISGKNAQGKTSILDAIWYGLGGAKNLPEMPIRKGEIRAEINLDLDSLKVKRVFTKGGTRLEVSNKEGAFFKSPQEILDRVLGQFTFDPLEFIRQDKKKQKETLLGLVNLRIDLNEIETRKKEVYDERTKVNREINQLEGQISSLPGIAVDLPEREIILTSFIEELQLINKQIQEIRSKQNSLEAIDSQIAQKEGNLNRLKQQRQKLEETFTAEVEAKISLLRQKKTLQDTIDKLSVPGDPNDIKIQMATAEETNRNIREGQKRQALIEIIKEKQEKITALAHALKDIDQSKNEALHDIKFPVEGLGFDETGVIYQEISLSQASDSEKLRVSMAIAMALNPTLRVIRITDGSLLDAGNMEILNQFAQERDYQIWIERVDETGKVGIYIEDGEIKTKKGTKNEKIHQD